MPVTSIAGASDGYVYEYVGIGRREEIPGNLPWYPLLVFGDNRPDKSGEVGYNAVTYRMRDEMVSINPFAVIGVGDHVWNGYVDQIIHFIQTFSNVPNVWVVAGNHEWNNEVRITSSNREGVYYWRKHVAPDLYYKDDIPGWRIVFINLREAYIDWTHTYNWLISKALNTDRKLIIVFHEPVYPIRSGSRAIKSVQDKLIPLLNKYHPAIILQGHIHCYYEGYRDGTLYIITGGGGAPKCSKYPYHYLYLILKPDGTYMYRAISTTYGSIIINRKHGSGRISETYYFTIENSKEDIFGKPISIPVRITFTINNTEYGLVFMAQYGVSRINIKYYYENRSLIIDMDKNKLHNNMLQPYIYDYNDHVWIIRNKHIAIHLTVPGRNNRRTMSSTTTTETTQTMESPMSTTSTSINHSIRNNTVYTSMNGKTSLNNSKNNSFLKTYLPYIALSLVLGMIGVLVVFMRKQ
jgi:hypothetical protein